MGTAVDLNGGSAFGPAAPKTSASGNDYIAQLKARQRAGWAVARKGRASFFQQPSSKPNSSNTGGGSLLGG